MNTNEVLNKLIAEIERLQKGIKSKWKENPRSSIDDGFLTACSQFLSIITSLLQEQPQVDIEKEYAEFVDADPVYSKLVNGIVGKSIARHFYELGINARKK